MDHRRKVPETACTGMSQPQEATVEDAHVIVDSTLVEHILRPSLKRFLTLTEPSPLATPYFDAEDSYQHALRSNGAWAGYKAHQDPDFFSNLASGQSPQILWIGCSDSRCPETSILGLQPGDVFVHRNIANIITATDTNVSAVIQYAVAHLKVKHIVLCGHSACGGAAAALSGLCVGSILDTWLVPLHAVCRAHAGLLASVRDHRERVARMAELNVEAGVGVLMANLTVQEAIRDRGLEVHGCFFDIGTGKVMDLGLGNSTKAKINGRADEAGKGKHAPLVFRGGGVSMAADEAGGKVGCVLLT